MLVIRRIHVVYHLQGRAEDRETIDRVFGLHANFCPVYRSIHKSIDVTTELRLTDPAQPA